MRHESVPVTMGSPQSLSIETSNFHVTEAWFPPGATLPAHTHDRGILAVMLRGGFETRIAQHLLDCREGFGWTEPVAQRHANSVGKEGAHVLVVQPDPTRDELLRPLQALLDGIHLLRDPRLCVEATAVLPELRSRDVWAGISMEARLMLLLATAARTKQHEEHGSRAPKWLMRVRERMQDEWRMTTSLTELASVAGVHPCHLAHAFRRYFGQTIGGFLRTRRLTWAIGQLAFEEKPIAHIALEAGFSDQSHFTRHCRRHTGLTPSAYRRGVRRVA
jgi:AraC family transcriptional regulator